VEGDKRHVRRALASRLMGAVGLTPAHGPEASVTEAIARVWAAPQSTRYAWPMDRAYRARPWVPQRPGAWAICCQAWPGRPGPYGPPSAFQLEWEREDLRGPGGETMPLAPGGVVQGPAATCGPWVWRARCPASASGRRVSLRPDAALVQEVRERQQTAQGRAPVRERVAGDHALAPGGRGQGRRARYHGVRKHVCDLRCCAVVHNLPVFMHLPQIGQVA